MSDYLWDKTGEPEEDVEQLENLLGALKYQPRPLDIPLSAMPKAKARPATTMFFSRPRLAIAASLLLTLLAGTWFITRQGETQKNQIVTDNKGTVFYGSNDSGLSAFLLSQIEAAKGGSVDNAVDNTFAPKPSEDKKSIVTTSSPKVHRASRVFVAKRQKSEPRRSVGDAPAPREFVAKNGGIRWETEQPLTPQQREATEKLMLALQLASAKFNYAQREMQEIGRAGK